MEDNKIDNLAILGWKIGMSHLYNEKNEMIPCTFIKAGPCPVTQVKTEKTDGYNAVQIGFEEQKEHRLANSMKGHFDKARAGYSKVLREFWTNKALELAGQVIEVSNFQEGEFVDITASNKGKGFQGVVKRHRFGGGPASHGSMSHRRGGSYGRCQWPGEIDKNRGMPGHDGNTNTTVQSLEIVKIVPGDALLIVKGSVPGSKGGLLYIQKAVKAKG